MRILITGATGLVGQEIVAQCHRKGYNVSFLTTRKEKIAAQDNYKGFYWNPAKGIVDENCLEGVVTIINLAGASISKRWTTAYKKEIIDSRVQSLETLYRCVQESKSHTVEKIISASAIGIYPSSLSKLYNEEEVAVDQSFLGEVVDIWETKIAAFKKLDLKVSAVRIGLVMSEDGGALPEIAKPINNYVGAAFGSGAQWQSWIHIKDLARMFLYIADANLAGDFNGVARNPITNARLVKEIAQVLEKPLILPNIPKFAMQFILGDMSYILFSSQRVSSKKIEDLGFNFYYSNIGNALEAIYKGKEMDISEMSTST